MYRVEIRVQFRAGHRLMPPYEGKCNNPHGEGYTAIFLFESKSLDKNGMVYDFGVVKRDLKKWIDDNLDHSYIHHMNDKVGSYLAKNGHKTYSMSVNPTAENIAAELFRHTIQIYSKLIIVGIIESFDDSIAWYSKEE